MEFEKRLIEALPHLRAYARYLAPHDDEAQDLVQDTCLNLWQRRHQFDPKRSFRAWAIGALRHRFIDTKRGKVRNNTRLLEPSDLLEARCEANQEHFVFLADVIRAFLKLKPLHQEVLILEGLLGLSYVETAEVLAIPAARVSSRLSKGREALKRNIEEPGVSH